MEDATTLLFDLDGFTVVSVQREDDGDAHGVRDVVVAGNDPDQACPSCGVVSGAADAAGEGPAARPAGSAAVVGPAQMGLPGARAPRMR